MMVIRECKDEINKQRSQDRLRKGSGSAPGDIPFDGFDFDGFWDDDESVSYTHLDVYKRQTSYILKTARSACSHITTMA